MSIKDDRNLPQITRTKRALVRRCYNQGNKMVSEIAEYAGCDASTVWYAIRNECHDDINEDQDYIDGRIGDVVDLWTRDESERRGIKMEDTEAEDDDLRLDDSASGSGESTPFFDCADPDDDGKLTNLQVTWVAETGDSPVDPIAGTSILSADRQDYHIRRASSALSSLTPLTESDSRSSEVRNMIHTSDIRANV